MSAMDEKGPKKKKAEMVPEKAKASSNGKHPGGRPPRYSNAADMMRRGEEFFNRCDDEKKPYTITGLALALGFNGRLALINYEGRPEFKNTVKKLKSRCERYAEERLFGTQPAGAIFALKNYDWTDKQISELMGKDGAPLTVQIIRFSEDKKDDKK